MNARQKIKQLKKELAKLKADRTNSCKWLRIDGLRNIPPSYFYYNDELATPEKYQIIIGNSVFEGQLFDPDILVVIDSEKLDKAYREAMKKMNLRQKAKKYKKLAELNSAKACLFDEMERAKAFDKMFRKTKKIDTFKMIKLIDNLSYTNSHYFIVEREIARDIGEYLLKNGYVDIEACNDEMKGYTRLSIIVEAVKQEEVKNEN